MTGCSIWFNGTFYDNVSIRWAMAAAMEVARWMPGLRSCPLFWGCPWLKMVVLSYTPTPSLFCDLTQTSWSDEHRVAQTEDQDQIREWKGTWDG